MSGQRESYHRPGQLRSRAPGPSSPEVVGELSGEARLPFPGSEVGAYYEKSTDKTENSIWQGPLFCKWALRTFFPPLGKSRYKIKKKPN